MPRRPGERPSAEANRWTAFQKASTARTKRVAYEARDAYSKNKQPQPDWIVGCCAHPPRPESASTAYAGIELPFAGPPAPNPGGESGSDGSFQSNAAACA